MKDSYRSAVRAFLQSGTMEPYLELEQTPRAQRVYPNATTLMRYMHAYGFDFDFSFVNYNPR